jgi:oligopeptide transport system ATP-binding protein
MATSQLASTPGAASGTGPILSVRNLKVWFPVASGLLGRSGDHVRAVDGVDLDIAAGETLGLVGESGCGKSTLGRAVIRLTETVSGTISFRGSDITHVAGAALRRLRREMAMVFQDPYASLNPRQTIGDIIGEPIDIHHLARGRARQKRIYELLKVVGLSPRHSERYPSEFSGGQRQRIGIARALALEPSLIVCDEPVSALDVSIQAQIINLLDELQRTYKLTYLFIAHDLSVVKHISDRVAVMYLGRIVETGDGDELYRDPRHPYTASLVSAIPIPDPELERARERTLLKGDIALPIHPPSGCRFRTRCPRAESDCAEVDPALSSFGSNHLAACIHPL